MKFIKPFVLIFTLIFWSIALAADNETPKVDIEYVTIDGRNWDSNSTETVSPWNAYNFFVKFENKWKIDVQMHVDFVDGTYAQWETPKPACKDEWDWNYFGQYVDWDTSFLIKAGEEYIWEYSLKIPNKISSWAWYEYSGELLWCITYTSAWISEGSADSMFGVNVRKAKILKMFVNGSDRTAPTVVSVAIWGSNALWWSMLTNVPIWSNIVIKFSEAMYTGSLFDGVLDFAFTHSRSSDFKTLTLHPINQLGYNQVYNLVLDNRFRDIAWNVLSDTKNISFKTVAQSDSGGWWGWGGWGWWWGWWWGGWWGWGGWWWWGGWFDKPTQDNCPDWDFSPSMYDWSCGDHWEVEHGIHGSDQNYACSIEWSTYSQEQNQAYIYACNRRISTMDTIQSANIEWPLLRKHLAKMISEFALKEIWLTPVEWRDCSNFADIADENEEMTYYIQLSCKLWLMWMESNWVDVKQNFDPNLYVTRAEFGTVLSRLLWWTTYATEDGSVYYKKHLQALKSNWIMTMIDWNWPNQVELRWYVMLMLMRTNERNLITFYNKDHSAATNSLDWMLALLWEDQTVVMEIENGSYYTKDDFVPIRWTVLDTWNVKTIYVTHMNSNWIWRYSNYKLEKYNPWDTKFVFYAYRYYDSLTVNDINTYLFKFYDKNNKLITTKKIVVDHNYKSNWDDYLVARGN